MTHFETLFKSDIKNQIQSLTIQKLLGIHEVNTEMYNHACMNPKQFTSYSICPKPHNVSSLLPFILPYLPFFLSQDTQTPFHTPLFFENQPSKKIECKKLSGQFLPPSYTPYTISEYLSITYCAEFPQK